MTSAEAVLSQASGMWSLESDVDLIRWCGRRPSTAYWEVVSLIQEPLHLDRSFNFCNSVDEGFHTGLHGALRVPRSLMGEPQLSSSGLRFLTPFRTRPVSYIDLFLRFCSNKGVFQCKKINKTISSVELLRWISSKESTCQWRRHRLDSLGQEDPLEKEIVTHSSNLAGKCPWTEDPGGL